MPNIHDSNNSTVADCPACGANLPGRTTILWGHRLHVCPGCGAWHWLGENAPAADYEKVYETPEYEQVQVQQLEQTTDYTQFVTHATYAPFFHNVPRDDGAALLDVGCGVGRFLRAAKTQGWSVRGIDVAQRAIDIGKRTADFPMSCETLEALRQSGASFDAVTAFEVLEHVPQVLDMLRETIELIKPGGWFFCTVPNRECVPILKTKRQDWLPPVHVHYYTQRAMQALLQRAGLRGVRTGLISGSVKPTAPLYLARYAMQRLLHLNMAEPLGIWAMGRRAKT